MTYNDTIIADAPKFYYHLNEIDVNVSGRLVANSGSVGGNATMTKSASGTVTPSQPGAGTIGGSSWEINNNQIYGSQATGTVTSSKAWSLEVWWKLDTGYGIGSGITLVQMSGSGGNFSNMNIGIADTFSAHQVNATAAGTTTSSTAVNVTDGNWHHIVSTFDPADNKNRLYIDGVLRTTSAANINFTASTSATFAFGGVGVGGADGWVDEPAFYNSTLSATQVAAHYTAGTAAPSTPVTVTPPAISFGTNALTAPAPVVTAIKADVINPAPSGMSLDALRMVAPVVSTTSNATAIAPVMTTSLSASAPTVLPGTGIVNAVPAAVLSLVAVDPTKAEFDPHFQGLSVTQDKGTGSTYATTTTITLNNAGGGQNRAFLKTNAFTAPADMQLDNAKLYVFATVSTSGPVRLNKVTSDWSEASGDPTFASTGDKIVTLVSGWNAIDITTWANEWLSGTPNYGVAFSTFTSGFETISTRESANKPYIALTYADVVPVPVTVTSPAMTATLTAPAPVVTGSANVSTAVPAASLDLDVIAPGVAVGVSISLSVPAITAGLEFTGGQSVNPDYTTTATAITLGLTTPVPFASIRYEKTVEVPVMDFGTVETEQGVGIDLTTNILQVAPAMKGSVKMVGIYQKENDRYYNYVKTTMDQYAVWLEMDETSGNTAIDSSYSTAGTQSNMTYVGGPTFGVEGPELRKAVRFDGIDDYIHMDHPNSPGVPPYAAPATGGLNSVAFYGTHGHTVEFSIRTTAQNGTIFSGGGGGSSGFAPYPIQNTNVRMRLIDGQLWFHGNGASDAFKVRATINDGEWHHVIVTIPGEKSTDGFGRVYVDGVSALARSGSLGASGNTLMPRSVMANRTTLYASDGSVYLSEPDDLLAGDMRDFIYRMDYHMEQITAQKLYYEWSNSTVIPVPVATLTLAAQHPFKVRGNVKKMLAIYGLGQSVLTGQGPNTPDTNLFEYQSAISGMPIKHFMETGYGEKTRKVETNPHQGWGAAPFMMNGYLVYPVHITGNLEMSADGILNGEYDFTPGHGQLYDDETGLPRFVNLQLDLADDVTNYDVITVVNYPWEKQRSLAEQFGIGLYQRMPGVAPGDYTDFQWSHTRDQFRDSILEAAYDGVSLFVPEAHMAQHLGFIERYETHGLDRWMGMGSVDTFGSGNISNGAKGAPTIPQGGVDYPDGSTTNLAGYWIDQKHLRGPDGRPSSIIPSSPDKMVGSGTFDYLSDPQANWFRRIVATEPGLTDLPAWEWGEHIYKMATDPFDMKNNAYAWDIIEKKNGLQIGDLSKMSIYESYSGRTSWIYGPWERNFMISAPSAGVAGKVIAKEMVSYYGPYGQVVQNPYADNAIAIAAERGTIVRGRPIRGRAFMDFMDSDFLTTTISEDRNKNVMGGVQVDYTPSTWSYDSRRVRSVALTIILQKLKYDGDSGSFSVKNSVQNYIEFGDSQFIDRPYLSMNARGLAWIASAPELIPGETRSYAPSMELTLSAPAASITRDRNLDIPVNGTMRLDLEIRDAANFHGPSVEERVLPMTLDLAMQGIGAAVQVPAVTLTLSMPNALVDVGGEEILVYIDGDRNVTLFMKEDN